DAETRARMRVFADLMAHARFEEANAQALAIQQDAIVNGTPVPLAAQAGYAIAQTSTHLAELKELRRKREAGFLQVMMSIEKSHVPLPDEPPIFFPPFKKWRELTRLHKRFESGGFSDRDEKAREKALALEKKLNEPITLAKGLDANTPLKDALEYFSERYNITIIVDTAAFKEENAEVEIEEQNVKLPKLVGVSLGTAL